MSDHPAYCRDRCCHRYCRQEVSCWQAWDLWHLKQIAKAMLFGYVSEHGKASHTLSGSSETAEDFRFVDAFSFSHLGREEFDFVFWFELFQ